MFKYSLLLSIISDIFLKVSFGLIFFNYGYAKLKNLLNDNGEGLINMVTTIPFFSIFPVFFSWSLAIGEVFVLLGLVYGIFYFLPFSNLLTKLAGIMSLIISIVIVYQHILVWGDNIFSYGPFEIFNIQEGKKSIFGQILFLPISVYIIFNNRISLLLVSDNK
tara:strand:- start:857 stop:1345 length:489 start_codon:yes stop_codon:yes gene_type:complete